MKHFKVKFLVFISAILLFFGIGLFSNLSSMVVYAAPAEGYTETGSCGSSAYWYYYEDTNTLLIDGSGSLNTYSVGSAPWYSYRNSIKKIEVSSNITSMGAGLFSGMSALEELTIPFVGRDKTLYSTSGTTVPTTSDSYEKYRHYPLGYMFGTSSYTGGSVVAQYYSLDYLKNGVYTVVLGTTSNYYIPATLKTVNVTNSTYIFSGAFSNIYSVSSTSSLVQSPLKVSSITLNEGIKNIGKYAFASINTYSDNYLTKSSYQYTYSVLENINLPSTLVNIADFAFYNCQKLDSVEIPGSVTAIGNYGFYNCKKLYTNVGTGVVTVGDYSFANCTSLDNQDFSSELTTIGAGAFSGCTAFTEINLPSNITSIGNSAFSGCNKVTKIQIEEGLKTIGSYAFKDINKVTNLIIPTTVTSMGAGLFSGMSALEELTIPFVGRDKTLYSTSGTTVPTTSDSYEKYRHYPLGYMFGTSSYTGGSVVAQYYSLDYLKNGVYTVVLGTTSNYYIPATLKTVNVTNSTYIFSGAFSNIYSVSSTSSLVQSPLKVSSITLNEGIKNIGKYAFASINTYSDNYLTKSSYQYTYSVLENINLPSTLVNIADFAFYNCQKLDSVEIPGSVTAIGNYGFYNCKKLYTNVGTGVVTVGDYSFANCTSLDNQDFSSELTTIGAGAFSGCTAFTEINLPSNITSIGNSAFSGCNKVTKIQIEEGLKTIGSYAFKDINKVTNLIIPTTVTSMGAGLFSGMSALEELTIPFVGRDKTLYSTSGTTVPTTSDSYEKYRHYPLGYMFGTSSYTGGSVVAQYYSLDYLKNGVYTVVLGTTSNYYIPATLKTVNVTNSTYIFSGAFSNIYSVSSTSSLVQSPLKVSSITLNEGIKNIGKYAFASINTYSDNYLTKSSYQYTYSVLENINLPSTLVNIADFAFYNCQKLDSVEIPGSVTAIGNYGFYNCKKLYTNVGTGVVTVGDYSFANCTSLDNQTFPATITSIGNGAYFGCTSFTEINIPSSIQSIGDNAFSGCNNVRKIQIEEGLKTIGSKAFNGLDKVTNLIIPTTVTSMGEGIFSGMSALEELTIPFVGTNKNYHSGTSQTTSYTHYPLGSMFGTTSYTGGVEVYQFYSYDWYNTKTGKMVAYSGDNTNVYPTNRYYIPSSLKTVNVTNSKYIFSGAFSYAYSKSYSSLTSNPLNITTITLNEGIEGIGAFTFSSMNYYSSNSYINNTTYQYLYSKLETINLPSTLVSIEYGAFYNCQKLDSVEIPGTVTNIADYAFWRCVIAKIEILKQSTDITVYQHSFSNVPIISYFDYYSYTNGNDTFYYNVINEESIITKTVTTNAALTLPTTLGDYTVTKVANMGVANCTSVTSVVIPANIVELGDYAFSGCTGLTTVTIPSTCLHVGDYAFNGCTKITTTTIAEGVKYVGDYAFFNCIKLQEIVVPDSCEYLGQGAFYNCSSMISASIGITVPEINDYTFFNCSSMETIVVGLAVTSIGDYAFKNCSSISKITLRNGMLTVGDGAFMNCTSMTKATLAASITEIGSYAFYGCSALTSITVPTNVTIIEDSTFEGCTVLATASYNGTVEKIGKKAFKDTAITTFNFKAGLKNLGSGAFAHTQLTSVTLPDSLVLIGQHVFDGCQLETVSMPSGVKLDTNCTNIFADNGSNMIITVRFVEDTALCNYLLYMSGAKQIILEEGIKSIGSYTFAKNVFTEIELPVSLTSIGSYAFYLCENLEEIYVPINVTDIGTYAFAKDFVLKDVYIPDSLQSIGENAFYKVDNEELHEFLTITIYRNKDVICDSLLSSQHMQYVFVNDYITTIKNNVFANCSNLKTVSVPDTISSFGTNNFLNDNNVTLRIRNVDHKIDDNVYYDNLLYVTTVDIENGIERIGQYAFYNDTSLVVVNVPNTVNYIGQYAFYNCNSLKEINIPNGVEAIYSHTFFGCASLGSITTPNTVTLIEDYAFYGCVKVTSLIISNTCEKIDSHAFYNCKAIEELIIPDSVQHIGTYAFRSCVKITELRFSDYVEEIGACAFYDCNLLEKVYLGKRIIELDDRLFYGCVNLTDLYVYAPLSYVDELAFYGAEDCVIHMGYDTYMINMFDELGMTYEIDDTIIYEYKVVFADWDDSIISSLTYHSGDTVVVPDNPVRAADNTYTYTFKSWDKDIVVCGGNTVYKALYNSTYIDYTIIFKNYDGTELSNTTYHYGDTITTPETPIKPSDNTYSYTFAGWDNEVVAVAGNATYTATYTPVYIDYTVAFVDYDGTTISSNTYHYGDAVTAPNNPTRQADNTYTYVFKAWDKEVVNCAGDATYTATYTPTYIDYTVVFKNYDGTVLSTATYHYGDTVEEPSAPTKPSDETYDYGFSGWDKTVTTCDGDKIYTAQFTPVYIDYTIIFKNYDGTELSNTTYHYGDTVTTPETPIKPSDNTYSYTFAGWDNEVVAVAGNATYTATYTPVYIDYTVAFVDYDGTTISSNTYHYGDAVTAPNNPTRQADNTYTYVFKAWDKEVVNCAGDATYTATYTPTYIDYTVVFKNYDGTVLSTATYHYGDTVEEPSAPTKPSDETYDYGFSGWDKTVTTCDGDKIYTAQFTPVYIDYTIIFKNYDGTELSNTTYHYGDTVTTPETPIKPSDNTYSYTFAGWDNEVVAVAGNATYTATYTPVYIDYTVAFVDYDGTTISSNTYHYGDAVTAPNNPTRQADNTYTYVFKAWDKEVVNCAGDATYTATYTPTYIDYTVVFKNYDGTVLSTATYHYGDTVEEPSAPTKPSDETYDYGFSGWDKTVTTCDGDKIYTAQFTPVYIDYTIIFKNYDGTELSNTTYHYGDTVTTPETPIKPSDNTYSYTFAGWDNEVVAVAGNATYTATYTPVYIDYTVAFVDYDGTTISSNTYHYGDAVTAPNNPTRQADNTYTYVFKAWDKEVVNCAGDATYTATYTPTYIDYTVVFKNYDGTVLSTATYHYGDTVEEPSAPTKPSDETYDYGFSGWDKTVTTCDGDKIYTAQFTPVYIDYTIIFKNYDGTELSNTTYHYGDTVTTPETPIKPSDNTYSYTFAGWDNEVVAVAGNATYTATYTPVYIDYTVAFVDYDGTTISSNTYHYGDAVTAPNNPTRQADNTYTYVFKAWDKEVVNCAGDATYTATYTPTYIDYTVVFKNYDGTVLSTATYHYGDTVEEPSAPTKPSDETYDYGFSGWDKTVTTCDGDKIYTAQFTQIENAQHKSTELLNELTGIIDSINKVDLDTYQTIVSIQEQANELLDADKIKLNAKLQPIINQYVNYVKSINNEYAVAEAVESNYFLVVLEMINYISVLAYAVLKGRRWFL